MNINSRSATAAPGDLDTGFGTNGIATTPIRAFDDRAQSVAIQSDGKIVVAGEAQTGSNYDFTVAHFEGGNAPTAVTLVGFSVNRYTFTGWK